MRHFVTGIAICWIGGALISFARADITRNGAYVVEKNCVDSVEVPVGREQVYTDRCVQWGEPSYTPFAIWLQDVIFLGFSPVRWLALAFLASLYATIRGENA